MNNLTKILESARESFDKEIEHPFLLSENLGVQAPEKIFAFSVSLAHTLLKAVREETEVTQRDINITHPNSPAENVCKGFNAALTEVSSNWEEFMK